MAEERKYLIFSMSELDKIDFSKVLETSSDTLRLSLDGAKSFVKWDGEQPEFVATLTTAEGPYTYQEILEILNLEYWKEGSYSYEEWVQRDKDS